MIYKICPAQDWAQAVEQRSYTGSPVDRKDGFIHFSTGPQVAGTLAKYYAEANDLVLVAVNTAEFGEALRFERARDGALLLHQDADWMPIRVIRRVDADPAPGIRDASTG